VTGTKSTVQVPFSDAMLDPSIVTRLPVMMLWAALVVISATLLVSAGVFDFGGMNTEMPLMLNVVEVYPLTSDPGTGRRMR
jgi:hypothetical protein